MIVKLLTEHHLEFLRCKGSYTGLSESILVKMPHCWKSHFDFLLGCSEVEKALYPLISTGSTQENRAIIDMDVKQQHKRICSPISPLAWRQ